MPLAPWYYVNAERQRQGPVPLEELRALFEAGSIGPRSLVWSEGMPQWQPLEQVSAGLGIGLPPRREAEPQATASVHDGSEVVYAGFLKRFAAHVVDVVIVGIVGGVIGGIIGAIFSVALIGSGADPFAGSLLLNSISMVIGLALGLLYYGGFHASSSQATPGKMLIGIKVARGDGERLTGMRACVRFLATYINLFTLGIGWLMAAFTQRKQALHDFLCDTVVVDRFAYSPFPERQNRSLGGCAIAILIFCGLLFVVFGIALMAAIALPAFNEYTERATLGGTQAGIVDGRFPAFTLDDQGDWTCTASLDDRDLPGPCQG